MKNRSLIVYGHGSPERSSINKYLLSSISSIPSVYVHDVSGHYPDYGIDLHQELSLLSGIENLILQFPLYWYSMPAILKAWFDCVCSSPEVAKRPGLLHNKSIQVITTAGSDLYKTRTIEETRANLFWPIKQTAGYLGMVWRCPMIINNVTRMSNEDLIMEADKYRNWLLRPVKEETSK